MNGAESVSWWVRARPWLLTAGAAMLAAGVVVLVSRRFGADGGQFRLGSALVTVTRPAPAGVTVVYAGGWAGDD